MSDQIQPERDFYRRQRASSPEISGRAWVKRHLEFWHRCSIEHCDEHSITVSLDNMDELTVARDKVSQFELVPGELVFVQHWDKAINGSPGFVVAVNGEVADVEFPSSLYAKKEFHTCLLRDIRLYCDLELTDWKAGSRVFAYRFVDFHPPLFLLFPAVVRSVHFDVCVEVEFEDGETALVPATLVEHLKLNTGDTVHTCTSYLSHGTHPDERWGQCRIVKRDGDELLLEDDAGERFTSQTSMIAVLPKGHEMRDGKLEKIARAEPGEFRIRSARPSVPATSNDVHVVRTDHWLDAADDPITSAQIGNLIAADPELAWSSDDWSVDGARSILWNDAPCFWWNRYEILCAGPNERQLAKMIEIAIELDANVIGNDGKEYH